jgi:DASH complex subunit DAM1
MSTFTPMAAPPSHSHARKPSITRPTTPLRPPSRTSLRASQTTPSSSAYGNSTTDPLAALEPGFAELSDSMADLEANFMHLQLLNESLSRFNECFGAFLYGMNMSAFCVDFPEVLFPFPLPRARSPRLLLIRTRRPSQPPSPERPHRSPLHPSATPARRI